MAWIESHQSLGHHRKTLQAVAMLHVDRHKLIGHLQVLWWWGLDNADSSGKLGKVTARAVAEAAEWPPRDADRFVQVLVGVGFLERSDEGLILHDWYDYAGKLNDQRAKNRARMAEARVRRTNSARAPHGTPDVSNTFAARAPATGPDLTGPNRTGPTPPSSPPPNGAPHTCCTLASVTDGQKHSSTCPSLIEISEA